MRGYWKAVAAGLCLAVLGSGHGDAARSAADSRRLIDGSGGADWAAYGRTFGEQHYSPLEQINPGTVGGLGLAWSIDLPPGNSVTAPLAVDGVLYYSNGYSVIHAVEAATGRELWNYDPETWKVARQKLGVGWGSRGIAWWNGKIYVGTQDGRLIAIDAKTGKALWSAQTLDPEDFNYITGAPRVFDGKVIIGFGGADVEHSRGYVSTYDAETGKFLWRWWSVPGDPAKGFENTSMEMAAKTWAGQWWKYGGGGTIWNAMTYDPETDTIFLGTGNGSPWNHKARSAGKGDNLFLCSLVALDAKTGTYKWHYQFNPGETWDYNSVMDMPLATLTIGGKPRKVIMQAPKNGFYYVIDRITGKLISAEPYAKVTWASKIDLATGRPVENPAARFENGASFDLWPGSSGAHGWYPMAFSPKTNLTYIPVFERGASFKDFAVENEEWKRLQPPGTGQMAELLGPLSIDDPIANTSRLEAWDPARQKRVWAQPTIGNQSGGVLATGGNLVFQGQMDGKFAAYAADSGKLLWSFQANAPVIAPPITYTANGKQYVTVITGMGTSGGLSGEAIEAFRIDYRTQARRVLTFALGGRNTLPPRIADTLKPVDDPDFVLDKAQAERGALTFNTRCMQCHGYNAVAGGSAPDLRTSGMPLDAAAFKSVVHDGGLLPAGMPQFDTLTDPQLDELRQYIRMRAQVWRTAAKAPARSSGRR